MFSRVQASSYKTVGVMTCSTQRSSGSCRSTETLNGEKLLGVFEPQETKKHSKNDLPMICRMVHGEALKPCHKTEPVMVTVS